MSFLSCNQNDNEILIWTDPPADSIPDYENPVFIPDLADPTVVRAKDGWFYAYGTQNQWYEGVTRITPVITSYSIHYTKLYESTIPPMSLRTFVSGSR